MHVYVPEGGKILDRFITVFSYERDQERPPLSEMIDVMRHYPHDVEWTPALHAEHLDAVRRGTEPPDLTTN